MPITLTGVITGQPQTGLTSPTYTHATLAAPDTNGKASLVTTLGGTQVGVRTHTVSDPFMNLFVQPKVLKPLPQINPVTLRYPAIPYNKYMLKSTKGVIPALNIAPMPFIITTVIEVPAGSDAYDIVNVRAALSDHFGSLVANSAAIGDTANTGNMG